MDIMENANFAWSHAFGHKGLVDVHSFGDFWSWTRLGFIPLVVQPSWSYSEEFGSANQDRFGKDCSIYKTSDTCPAPGCNWSGTTCKEVTCATTADCPSGYACDANVCKAYVIGIDNTNAGYPNACPGGTVAVETSS